MNKTQREDEAWHYKLQAKFIEPDVTSRMIGMREWRRDHPLCCPVCGVVFFGYQPSDTPFQPYGNASESGPRQTCGHPECWGTEVSRHQKLDGMYVANVQMFQARKVESQKKKTTLDHI